MRSATPATAPFPLFVPPGANRRDDSSKTSSVDVMPLLTGPREGEFAWHEISTRVNHVTNDDAQLILPITGEEMAAQEIKPAKKPPRKPAAVASR